MAEGNKLPRGGEGGGGGWVHARQKVFEMNMR